MLFVSSVSSYPQAVLVGWRCTGWALSVVLVALVPGCEGACHANQLGPRKDVSSVARKAIQQTHYLAHSLAVFANPSFGPEDVRFIFRSDAKELIELSYDPAEIWPAFSQRFQSDLQFGTAITMSRAAKEWFLRRCEDRIGEEFCGFFFDTRSFERFSIKNVLLYYEGGNGDAGFCGLVTRENCRRLAPKTLECAGIAYPSQVAKQSSVQRMVRFGTSEKDSFERALRTALEDSSCCVREAIRFPASTLVVAVVDSSTRTNIFCCNYLGPQGVRILPFRIGNEPVDKRTYLSCGDLGFTLQQIGKGFPVERYPGRSSDTRVYFFAAHGDHDWKGMCIAGRAFFIFRLEEPWKDHGLGESDALKLDRVFHYGLEE